MTNLNDIQAAVAATFDQHEPSETRQARWEAAALAAGREVDRNALRAYMAVADAEQKALAEEWARSVASTVAEVRRLRTELDALADDSALLAALQAAGVDNWEGYDDALERC